MKGTEGLDLTSEQETISEYQMIQELSELDTSRVGAIEALAAYENVRYNYYSRLRTEDLVVKYVNTFMGER